MDASRRKMIPLVSTALDARNLSGLLMERFALLAVMGIRCFWPHKIIGRAGLVVHQAWKLRPLPASHQYSPLILLRPWLQSRSVLHLRELHTPPCGSARLRRYVPFYWPGLQLSDCSRAGRQALSAKSIAGRHAWPTG
jgi:hypothetical protein